METKRDKVRLNEGGFASIVIAFVMVVLLTLTTLGFAQLVRKEQRSALDKHLSNQAFYAAETGINDTAKALAAGFALNKSQCGPYSATDLTAMTDLTSKAAASQYLASTSNSGQGNNVGNNGSSYSCLTINPTPESLEFGSVGTVESKVTQITGADRTNPDVPRAISRLRISWQDSGSNQTPAPAGLAASHSFDKASNWNYIGVLRASLTPIDPGQISRAAFSQNTYSAFFYPNGSNSAATNTGNGTNTAADTTGEIIDGNCNPAHRPLNCNVEITGLNATNYLLDLRSIYRNTRVSISATDASGNSLRFKNSQTVVDSTGKAQDVLRRIQVRIPSRSTFAHSDFSLESLSGICKQLKLVPPAAGSSSNACTP